MRVKNLVKLYVSKNIASDRCKVTVCNKIYNEKDIKKLRPKV